MAKADNIITNKLTASIRTESGKGAARRARREGYVPAVFYGRNTTPQHLLLPNRELAAIFRHFGANTIIELSVDGKTELVYSKQVDVHPVRSFIQHVDLVPEADVDLPAATK